MGNACGTGRAQEIDEIDFKRIQGEYKGQVATLKKAVATEQSVTDRSLAIGEDVFNFAAFTRTRFLDGDIEQQRRVLISIGENLTLKGGKLLFKAKKWFAPVGEQYSVVEAEYLAARTPRIWLHSGTRARFATYNC